MARLVLACTVTALVLAGCGGQSATKQAEQVGALAAEGAILAHDAAEGDTTTVFTRVHARDLAGSAEALAASGQTVPLRRLAQAVAADLRSLAGNPGDEGVAGRVERRLKRLHERAGALA
ncbi:MAG TPA: hypothetical protein VLB86_11580 [Gaiellaceae bacterium]|nr:hypothetical protein [Gaiellaceae bacterium]